MKPASAILLAAGRGKRQRPYTDEVPKPLLEIEGRPTLDYVLAALDRANIRRVCLVTNYLEQKIRAFSGDGSKWNLKISYAHQTALHGSGDALGSVPETWRPAGPVLVVATDYALKEAALQQLVRAHVRHGADLTLSLKECPADELMKRSCVEVDDHWRVSRIIEKPKRREILSPYAASIMLILPPAIWDYLPRIEPSPRGEIELPSAVDAMLRDGFTAHGVLQTAPREWEPPSL
ncbi:MAG TPA: nucleotidyltransferase family protein, partial [Streptosporangiaceae bacterium]|nr:nucleotidyltransferase family protein [Streptosporangiaceae bacterium]